MFNKSVRFERLAIGAGIINGLGQIAFVILFAITIVPHLPAINAPVDEHVAFYQEHLDTLRVVNYVGLWTIPFFLIFLGGIFVMLRRSEGGIGVLTAVGVGSAAALAMTWASGVAVAHAGQTAVAQGLEGASAWAMDSTAQLALGLSGFPRAVLIGALSLALRASGQMSRTTFVVGLLIVALSLLGTADFVAVAMYVPAALASLLGGVWLAGIAAAQMRRSTA